MAKAAEKNSTTVAFRLPQSAFEELSRRAAAAGQSVHEQARSLVFQQLEQRDSSEVLEEIGALRQQHYELRNAIGLALEAVLLNVTDLPEKKVRGWIREKIVGSTTERGDE